MDNLASAPVPRRTQARAREARLRPQYDATCPSPEPVGREDAERCRGLSSGRAAQPPFVVAGLGPAIPLSLARPFSFKRDGRYKPGHDDQLLGPPMSSTWPLPGLVPVPRRPNRLRTPPSLSRDGCAVSGMELVASRAMMACSRRWTRLASAPTSLRRC